MVWSVALIILIAVGLLIVLVVVRLLIRPKQIFPNEYCAVCGRERGKSRGRRFYALHGMGACSKCRNGFANRRQGAYIVDAILLAILSFAVGASDNSPIFAHETAIASALTVIAVPYWVYAYSMSFLVLPFIFIFKDGIGGRSPGKRICGISVYDATQFEPIGFKQSFKRNLSLMIPYLGALIGVGTMMKGQRWGERWANTMVIWEKHKHKAAFDPRGLRCLRCGYNLHGNTSGRCPECGLDFDLEAHKNCENCGHDITDHPEKPCPECGIESSHSAPLPPSISPPDPSE